MDHSLREHGGNAILFRKNGGWAILLGSMEDMPLSSGIRKDGPLSSGIDRQTDKQDKAAGRGVPRRGLNPPPAAIPL